MEIIINKVYSNNAYNYYNNGNFGFNCYEAEALGRVHNSFACVVLRPEVNVNTYCNARIAIPTLRCVAKRVQINLYALTIVTRRKQNIVNQLALCFWHPYNE